LFDFCLTRPLICYSFDCSLIDFGKADEVNRREGGIMSISKLRNSTAIDTVLTNGTVANALKLNPGQGDLAQSNKPLQDVIQNTATDRVSMYLRGISEHSTDKIDTLISDLSVLRQKLVADGSKIEQDLTDYATLNQSVLSLTKIVSESVAQVKAPQTH
jgi:hypothetical protein